MSSITKCNFSVKQPLVLEFIIFRHVSSIFLANFSAISFTANVIVMNIIHSDVVKNILETNNVLFHLVFNLMGSWGCLGSSLISFSGYVSSLFLHFFFLTGTSIKLSGTQLFGSLDFLVFRFLFVCLDMHFVFLSFLLFGCWFKMVT